MTEHALGPWWWNGARLLARHENGDIWAVLKLDLPWLEQMEHFVTIGKDMRLPADMALIAAAPALLAACKARAAYVHHSVNCPECSQLDVDCIEALRLRIHAGALNDAALAAAKGEQ